MGWYEEGNGNLGMICAAPVLGTGEGGGRRSRETIGFYRAISRLSLEG
jgi:hypothetical protein